MPQRKVLPKVCYKITNAEKLLNGITSNELSKPKNAFLDRFGKLIILFDQKLSNGVMFIVFENRFEQLFLDHINIYAKLTKSAVEKINEHVVHVLDGNEEGIVFPQNAGHLQLTKMRPENEMSEEEYTLLRLENNIPVQGIDFGHEMFLDTGIDAVSFAKGCFLGQEVMERVDRSKPQRKIVRILYDTIPENATVKGEAVGKITSSAFSKKYGKFICFTMIRRYEEEVDDGMVVKERSEVQPRE